jgi:hypothetical protein
VAVGSPRVILTSLAYLAVRPEGAIVLGSSLLVWLGLQRARRKPAGGGSGAAGVALWALLVGLLFALLVAFRTAYFGSPFPQPVSAKVGGAALERIADGLYYLGELLRRPWASALALVLAALPFVLWRELRRPDSDWPNVLSWLLVGANAAFIVLAGGDWMKGARFVAHFAPLGLVLGHAALRKALPAHGSAVVALLVVGQLAGLLALAYGNTGQPLWQFARVDPVIRTLSERRDYSFVERANRIRTRDILFLERAAELVERMLEEQDRVVVMSGQAGMVFYYLAVEFYGRVEFVDRFGLSTPHVVEARDELGLGSSSSGVVLSMRRFLEEAPNRREPAWSPDLVFDVHDTREPLERSGYRVVYVQGGVFPGTAVWIGSRRFRYDLAMFQLAAVEEELAARLGLPRATQMSDWSGPLSGDVRGPPR